MPAAASAACQDIELRPMVRTSKYTACKRRMIANGWCHHHVNYLATRYKLETFDYLSTLKYMRAQKHDLCRTRSSCVAYTVNNSTYQTRHAESGCSCAFIETPYEDLKRVTETGGIPLVEIEENSGYRLSVRRRERDSRYVAISHVWTDGLGNPSQCALPFCQIKRLHETVESTFRQPHLRRQRKKGPVLIWMDTLCIPPSDPIIRMAQIDKMASVYKGAFTCLILDAEIMALEMKCIGNSPDLAAETKARFVCSAWNSRSWTLQEGALPKHLTILFAANTLAEIWNKSSINAEVAPQRTTCNGGITRVPGSDRESRISSDLDMTYLNLHKIGYAAIWNELAGRATSQPADIPLIMCNLLNLEIGDLLSYDLPEEKYQAILLGLPRIPLSVFSNSGPRYHGTATGRAGLSWIPTAIGKEMIESGPLVHKYPDGFLNKESHLFLRPGETNSWFILRTPRLPLPKYLEFPGANDRYRFEPSNLYLTEADIKGNVETCIVLNLRNCKNGLRLQPYVITRGSCYSVMYEEKRILAISFRGPLRFAKEKASSSGSCVADVDDTLYAEYRGNKLHFKIMYDLLPGVKGLTPRPYVYAPTMYHVAIPTYVVFVACCIGGLGFIQSRGRVEPSEEIMFWCGESFACSRAVF